MTLSFEDPPERGLAATLPLTEEIARKSFINEEALTVSILESQTTQSSISAETEKFPGDPSSNSTGTCLFNFKFPRKGPDGGRKFSRR